MRNHTVLRAVTLLALSVASPVHAERLNPKDVPVALQPWIDWALHGHHRERCVLVGDSSDENGAQQPCAWPSRLKLDLNESGGSFRQDWWVEVEGQVVLPGGPTRWPEGVTVDGTPAVVISKGDRPVLDLAAGQHTVAGTFEWEILPPQLEIPSQTGLLDLVMHGRRIVYPSRDEQGRLWIKHREEEQKSEDTLDVVVHRRIIDEVPMQVDTRIGLKVSGRNREVLLGKVLLAEFIPMSLSSPVPVRIEPDGRLRVQVRPGQWEISLVARQGDAPTGPLKELALVDPGQPWDDEEVWVFEARPNLRLVQIERVSAIDPKQTAIPSEWQGLPAYLMKSGTVMRLVEKQRGDAGRVPDRLALERTWWLDFDGGGVTIRDQISGTIGANARLSMAAPTQLGRAALGTDDQFITRLAANGPLGIEIRHGEVQIQADSRFEGNVSTLPSVGWLQDFHSVSGTFKLPPGWRLIHVFGVDDVSHTWVASWTLLDIFLALVTVVGVARLWGLIWGAVAAITLLCTWVEPGAPQLVWIAVLAGEALVRAAGQMELHRLARALTSYRAIAVVALLLVSLSYVTGEVRKAVYPVLEHPRVAVGATQADQAAAPMEERLAQVAAPTRLASRGDYYGYASKKAQTLAPDPNARVQTGPGVPSWAWNQVRLRWRGPVEHSRQINLILFSPGLNRFLGFLRAVLVLTLLGCVLRAARDGWGDLRRLAARTTTATGLSLLVFLVPSVSRAADLPPKELLDQLRQRLLEKPECLPECVSCSRLHLDVSKNVLTARMKLDAGARSAVALPGGGRQWHPEEVWVDDQPARGLLTGDADKLWLLLEPGKHTAVLRGALPARDSVQIHLPTHAQRVTAKTEGWRLDGLHRDGSAEENLQLTRVAPQADEMAPLEPGRLPPFVEVKREIILGLTWSVETTVTRMTPLGTAAVLEIPLLPNESVITAGIEVAEGRAIINLGPTTGSSRWESVLQPTDILRLEAPTLPSTMERWRLTAGSIWHVEVDGIPAVHQPTDRNESTLEWRPWGSEVVKLEITRPEGAVGRTLTIDNSVTTVAPGLRATDVSLAMTIRSSRGTQHPIKLPPNSILESVAIDGAAQPIRAVGRKLTLPIAPGRHAVEVKWQETRGINARFVTPAIDIGSPSVNSTVRVKMPRDRWILFAGGQQVGPIILFWPVLVVLVPVAFLLGQIRLTPLRPHHWFLLGLGLTQIPIPLSAIVVGWLLALGWRGRQGVSLTGSRFNLVQLALVGWSGLALLILLFGIQHGLLGLPEMQVVGNGSHAYDLRWFHDRTDELLPEVWVGSISLLFYRVAMLLWALWLTQALLSWLKWGWNCFNEGGIWQQRVRPESVSDSAETKGASGP